MSVFITLLTTIATLMHSYLSWRIIRLDWLRPPPRRRKALSAALIIWLVSISGLLFGHSSQDPTLNVVEQCGLNWLGTLFIATTVMLSLDIVTGFGRWARPYLNQLRLGALTLATLLIAIAVVQGVRPPEVVYYAVTLDGLPAELNGTRVVVVADLHLGSQLSSAWLSARQAQIEQLNPDLIILLGDIFEGHDHPDPALESIFARLRAPLGIYAVTGNHEFHGDSNAAITMTEAVGIEWLRNRVKEITPGLMLAGIDDVSHAIRSGNQTEQISPLLQGKPAGATLLLSHSPLQVVEAADSGVDLMISAHTHNGQIWPFNYLVQRFYPYINGRYQIDDMTLIVNRGTGLWGPRMRLWKPAEITFITLRSNEI